MIFHYISNSTFITIFILIFLSLYFIIAMWIFVYKILSLNRSILKEKKSLSKIYSNSNLKEVGKESYMYQYLLKISAPDKKAIFLISVNDAMQNATTGLTYLSIIASTSPFIGLFGTVIAILETFSKMGLKVNGNSINILAPAISEALVATAGGIIVAAVAYTFHLILKRKAYQLNVLLENQVEIILSRDSKIGINN